jgi:hypothetical protein
MCKVMGLPGKPDGMAGSEVEKYYRERRIREIAEYCETDVVNTYRVWLRYELFRGRLSDVEFQGCRHHEVEPVTIVVPAGLCRFAAVGPLPPTAAFPVQGVLFC